MLAFSATVAGSAARASVDLSRALDQYQSGRYREAREMFLRLAPERNDAVEIDFHLGRLALWFDDAPEAQLRLERAVEQAPGEARLHQALGDAYGLLAQQAPVFSRLGLARRCLAAYERAVALEPRRVAYHWSLLGYHCMAPWVAGGSPGRAAAAAARIAALDEQEGRIARATLALRARQTEAAFAEFDSVLRQDPADFVALYHVGRCAALSGTRIEDGISALEQCLTLRPPERPEAPTLAFVHFRLGQLYERRGDPGRAAAALAEARRVQPDLREVKILLRY